MVYQEIPNTDMAFKCLKAVLETAPRDRSRSPAARSPIPEEFRSAPSRRFGNRLSARAAAALPGWPLVKLSTPPPELRLKATELTAGTREFVDNMLVRPITSGIDDGTAKPRQ